MRDIIWTLIVIWLIYKIVELFKGFNSKKTFTENTDQKTQTSTNTAKKDIHSALKNHMNKEGEYVDFEEIK